MAFDSGKKTRISLLCTVLVILLLLIGTAIFVLAGAARRRGRQIPPAMFSVFFTCDTQGHIEPCGCTSGMAGGISRRQTYLVQNRVRDFLLVDAGDVTAGPREWELLELEYILKGYEKMGYHAVNIGRREASLSFEDLQKIKAQYSKLVSANVVGPGGKLVADPYVIVTLSSGYRCGIIGVLDETGGLDLLGKGIEVTGAAEAISRYLPELRKKCDYVVLLAFADENRMKALARQFFEIDVIVGGDVQKASADPLRENRSVIVFNTDKGKAVGRLDVEHREDGPWQYSSSFHRIAESMKKDAVIAAIEDQYKQQLKERDFRPVKDDAEHLSSISAARSAQADHYAGGRACESCHPLEQTIWEKSKHAQAFATLEVKGDQYNPRCLKCHTVGYMASDGYINERLTPNLKAVSCEACHGRGFQHIQLKQSKKVDAKRDIMKSPACETCHDSENSPQFDRQKYWKEIEHAWTDPNAAIKDLKSQI
jgi:hypothetical protein